MKATAIILPFLLLPMLSQAQTKDYSEDVSSIDHIIHALYASISGEKGVPRDWDRFAYLFAENARLVPTRKTEEGLVFQQWTPAGYAEMATEWFNNSGFFEAEIARELDEFGPIAHVFSTYTSRRTEEGEIFARGINSIQLFHDGARWWIMSVYWSAESEGQPIPAAYLPD
ncbi:MAG: hypothetical protein AAF433_17380 [Bacteroidota bacterium]